MSFVPLLWVGLKGNHEEDRNFGVQPKTRGTHFCPAVFYIPIARVPPFLFLEPPKVAVSSWTRKLQLDWKSSDSG